MSFLNLRKESIQLEKLFTRYALAPFEQADVIVIHERFENKAAGELIIPNLLMEETDDNSKDLRDQDRLCAKKLRILMSQSRIRISDGPRSK